ncbi:hypothetical protein SASPL_106151 [Salvia splendens]|uniref:3-hydroxyisobutyryl-CoA hydrolase n=1 Tax=Salvia splendens TaxID=180675 RepID=A0A8X8YN24_SALSN|nr:hypothetical protein SASPL_106151 [Salvia splendens]
MASTNGETDQECEIFTNFHSVLVEEMSCGRIFMLNRPKHLNALSAVTVCLRLIILCSVKLLVDCMNVLIVVDPQLFQILSAIILVSCDQSDIIERCQKLLIRAIGAWIAGNWCKKESYPFCSWLSSLLCSCICFWDCLKHVSRLLELFLACAEDSSVKFIIVNGKGRAFCAGGDVAAVVNDINQGSWKSGANYFRKEYTVNYVIATYSKPQVSILNGIVMGGGAGVSVHGRFRIATEKSHLDYSFLLCPKQLWDFFQILVLPTFCQDFLDFFGEYVGLTGTRLDGAEMLACGLATHFESEKKHLLKADSGDPLVISTLDVINKSFSRRTVEDIIAALEKASSEKKDDWIPSTIQSLKKASPMSLNISLRSIREGRLQGIGECLLPEFRMVCHVMLGEVSKDFVEGCRAILLDKDRNPKWSPSKLEAISDEMVDCYFSKLDEVGWEDLKLPVSSMLPAYAIAKL